MARLPVPGGDNGNWGDILNEYLSESHNSDGTLKEDVVTANAIASGSIVNTVIADDTIEETKLASGVRAKLNQVAPTWSTLSGKPSVIASGGTQAQARSSIDAVSMDDVTRLSSIAASYRPLQGITSAITSNITQGLSPDSVAYNWWEAEGKVRWCGVMPEGLSTDQTLALNNNNSFGQSFSFQPLVFEFWSNAQDISITGYDVGNADVWAIVDDMRIANNFTHIQYADSYYTWTLSQTSAVWRKWRLCVSTSIYQITHNNGAQMIPTAPGFQLAIVGDSYVQGNISIDNAWQNNAGRITAGTVFGEFEQRTGLDVWRCAVAGSGYATDANFPTHGRYGSAQRVGKLASLPEMDAVLVVGTINDKPVSIPTVVSAANAAWTAIKAAQPQAPLIVAGPEGFGWGDSQVDALNDALRTAAEAHQDVHSYIDLRGKNNYLTGTGYEGSPQNDGNSDVFVASDSTHPTHLGARYGSEYIARIIGNVTIPANQ